MSTDPTTDLTWIRRGACADADPETFFPGNQGIRNSLVREAVAICAGCPVRMDCCRYIFDLEANSSVRRFGIFAGLTPRQRNVLARTHRIRATTRDFAVLQETPDSVIRAWATTNGLTFYPRGRVAKKLRHAYLASLTTQEAAS